MNEQFNVTIEELLQIIGEKEARILALTKQIRAQDAALVEAAGKAAQSDSKKEEKK